MRINYESFINHLNKAENRQLKKDWKSFAKDHELDIFAVLNSEEEYNTNFREESERLDDYKPRVKRRYQDYDFKKDIIEKIAEIKQATTLTRNTQDKIIKIYQEIKILQKALDSTRPQSNPEQIEKLCLKEREIFEEIRRIELENESLKKTMEDIENSEIIFLNEINKNNEKIKKLEEIHNKIIRKIEKS